MSKRTVCVLVLSLLSSAACAKSQGEKVRDARMAQIDAREEVALAAVDRKARTSGAAVEREQLALRQAVDKSNQPGQEATAELVEVQKERAVYQAQARAQMEKLTIRLTAAKEKIDVLGPHAPTSLQTLLQTATTEHDDLAQDMTRLGSVPPDSWAATRSAVDRRLSTLDERISELNDAIHDV